MKFPLLAVLIHDAAYYKANIQASATGLSYRGVCFGAGSGLWGRRWADHY
jgi:hypothetical protein